MLFITSINKMYHINFQSNKFVKNSFLPNLLTVIRMHVDQR